MVRIDADPARNRLLIAIAGSPTAEQLALARTLLDGTLSRLRSPVDVLNDIRELQELGPELLEEFLGFGKHLGRFGVRRTVRIVGRSAKAAVNIERLARHLKGHAAHLAFSEAEAEAVFNR